MNGGVKIILERMRTHPDEFVLGSPIAYDSKWGSFLREIMDAEYFDETEKDAVRIAIREANREDFTGRVMQRLAGEDKASDEGKYLFRPLINPYYGQGLVSQIQAGQSILSQSQQVSPSVDEAEMVKMAIQSQLARSKALLKQKAKKAKPK